MTEYVELQVNMETGEVVEVVRDRREHLIFMYGLDADTTLEEAEQVEADYVAARNAGASS